MTTRTGRRAIVVGDKATLAKTFSHQDVVAFAELSGDHNPVHLNDEFAAGTRFGRRIVHGMLAGSLISAILGTRLPGPGSIYLSQTLEFRGPVYIGDTVTATVEVIAVREEKRLVTLKTTCTNQGLKIVIDGQAVVLLAD